jgi:hypothetical protein
MDGFSPGSAASGAEVGRLAYVFARLYPMVAESRRVLDDAGLEQVLLGGKLEEGGLNRWWDLLNRARDSSRLDALLTRALQQP